MPVFLEHLIEPFYEPVGATFRRAYVRGQIFFAPIGYTQENLEVWRPQAYDASRTSATAFRLVPAPGDAFARDVPLHTPRLETNEEFLGVRAKRRPVILLNPVPPDPQVPPVRGGGRVYRRLALVVPIFSLVHRHTGEYKYHPVFVERLRMLAYPEFLYLPPHPGVLAFPSYARVGEMQAVYGPHLDARDLKLSEEVLRILQDQVTHFTTGRYEGALADYREQLMNQGDTGREEAEPGA